MSELELRDFPLLADDASTATQAEAKPEAERQGEDESWLAHAGGIAVDVLASIVFWFVLLFVPLNAFYIGCGVVVFAMILYRVWLVHRSVHPEETSSKVPYTCGVASADGRELILVATLHISPRSPKDVEAVVDETRPDVVMIELDDERLNRMRDPDSERWNRLRDSDAAPGCPAPTPQPRQGDLQPIKVFERGTEVPATLYAQRAIWNAEWEGTKFSGVIVPNDADPYGLAKPSRNLTGCVSLVKRGAPDDQFAPFALKAFKAASAGAEALLVINSEGALPIRRLGTMGSWTSDLKVAWHTGSCGFPPIPTLLLPHEEGVRLLETTKSGEDVESRVEFVVLPDSHPRRTLRRRFCQSCALMLTGIGILYGVIQCFSVEVGGEFLAAEVAALARRIPCVCIDVDMDRFWGRLGAAVLPTPQNILRSMFAWLAFPRVFFRLLFPSVGSVDVPGGMVLHALSFPLRVWFAFGLAGFCASFVTSQILQLFCTGAEKAAEGSGVVHAKTQEDREAIQSYIMLGIEVYLMPRIYEAVAASRDEAMYTSIVAKCRDHAARRVVVVAGAGHANGILQRVRSRGLGRHANAAGVSLQGLSAPNGNFEP